MADKIPNIESYHHEKEVHLLDYLHVIHRRWRIALIIFALVFAGFAIHTFTETPLYQATAKLRIGYKADTSAQVLRTSLDHRYSIQSEIQVIKSNPIAEAAVEKGPFDWVFDSDDVFKVIQLKHLEVPESHRSLQIQLTGPDTYLLRDSAGKTLLEGVSGELTESDGMRCEISIQNAKKGSVYTLKRISEAAAVNRVRSGLNVQEFGEGLSILLLSVVSPDPVLAANATNAIATAYFENNRASRAIEANAVQEFIAQQLQGLGDDLDRSEQAYQEFRINTGLERLSPEGKSLVDAAVTLEKQRAELRLQYDRIDRYLKQKNWQGFDFSAVDTVPGVTEMVQQLLRLRAENVELLRKFTPAHPEVSEVEGQMRKIREQIFAAAELARSRIAAQLKDVESALRDSSRMLEQFPEEELELVRLSRARQVNAELYSYLLKRQQEARIQVASASGNVEIIDLARVPSRPFSPDHKKQLLIGLLVGGLLGLGATFLLEYLDRTIKDADDVEEKLGLTVIGTIPRIKEAETNEERQLVTQLDPMSAAAEAFLALRTNLLYTITNQKHKTVLLSSCMPGEGKSTVAVNLAATLAQTGARTLLVGCDLRRPSLFKALGEAEAPGLTDLLMNDDFSAIRKVEHLNLDFIPAGTEPPNPTQILNSQKMQSFLNGVNERYDYVILDAPPLLPVADALILASKVDLNVMVIESCRIPEKIAKRALDSLHNHGASIAGIVLNDKTGKGAKYYGAYSYYEGKYYQGYYRRDEPEPVPPLPKRILSKIWRFING